MGELEGEMVSISGRDSIWGAHTREHNLRGNSRGSTLLRGCLVLLKYENAPT